MARYIQARRGNADLPRLKLRSGKEKAEWEAFKKSAAMAFKLNEDARTKGEDVSYSIRDDGQIWKFARNDSDAWRRVADWVPEPESESVLESENC